MSKRTKYTTKPGTIGRTIELEVLKLQDDPMRFYILERALEQACEMPGASILVGGKLVSQTPGYEKCRAKMDALWAKIKAGQEAEKADKPVDKPVDDYTGENAFGNPCPRGSLADCKPGHEQARADRAARREANSGLKPAN